MVESRVQRFPQARPTIRARLIGGALVVLLLLVISGLVNFWAQTQLQRTTSAFQREAERVAAAREAAWASADLLATTGHAASWQDVAYLTEALDTALVTVHDVSDSLGVAMADLPEDDEVQVEARRAHEHMISLESLAQQMVSSAQAENWVSVQFYQTQMLLTYRRIAVESLDRVVTLAEGRQAAAAAQAATARQLASFVPAGFAALALVVTAITVFAAVRSITGPVERLARGATRLAEGHLEERVPAGGRDELGHLAAVFNEMADRIQSSHGELEGRVAERTRGLHAAVEVGRATTSVLDPDELLRQVVELVRERFGLYYVGLFLMDEEWRFAVLGAGTGEAGRQMIVQGHRLAVGGESMIGQCVADGQARIALDVGAEAVRFDNPLLPETRSEMALPLRSRGRVIGAMTVQSAERAAFDEADVAVMQTMADQVGVAIDNARLFAQTQAVLEEMEATQRRYLGQAWAEYARGMPVSGYEQTGEGVVPLGGEVLPEVARALGDGRVIVEGGDGTGEDQGAMTGSSLVVPVVLRGEPLGALGFKQPAAERKWSADDVALAKAIAEQVALAADNLRLLAETQGRAARERLTSEVAARMRETLDMETVLQTAVREIGEALGVAAVEVRVGRHAGGTSTVASTLDSAPTGQTKAEPGEGKRGHE